MKTTKFFTFVALITSLFLSSCSKDKIEETIAVPVDVPNFTVNIPTTVESLKSTEGLNYFSGSGTISIDEQTFRNIKNNQSNIMSETLKIGAVKISVSGLTGRIEEVTFSSPGIKNFVIEEYIFGGDAYSNPGLTEFAKSLFLKFLIANQVTINVEGYTDVEDEGDLEISLRFEDIELKAKVIKL